MSEAPSYIIPDKAITESETTFHVKKMPKFFVWIVAIFFSLLPIAVLSLFYILVLFIIYFVAIRLWVKYGQKIAKSTIIEFLKSCLGKGKIGLIGKLVGFKFEKYKTYYMEAEILDLNMMNPKHTSKRMLELVLTCIGFSFIIAQLYYFTQTIESADEAFNMIMISAFIVGLMPIALFWFIPVIWTVDDLRIRGIDKFRDLEPLEETLRRGIFGKILGVAGVLMAFNFIKSLVSAYPGRFMAGNENPNAVTETAVTTAFLLLALVIAVGPAYLVGAFYLNDHHAQFVNDMRIEVAKLLPTGVTSVRNLRAEELVAFKHNTPPQDS